MDRVRLWLRYARAHVITVVGRNIDLSDGDVLDCFCILPAPKLEFDEWLNRIGGGGDEVAPAPTTPDEIADANSRGVAIIKSFEKTGLVKVA
jgi:hypothetical protein